ncbi:hypothetical protein VUR80DRAFT_10308 [Thermomyces stellatus]
MLVGNPVSLVLGLFPAAESRNPSDPPPVGHGQSDSSSSHSCMLCEATAVRLTKAFSEGEALSRHNLRAPVGLRKASTAVAGDRSAKSSSETRGRGDCGENWRLEGRLRCGPPIGKMDGGGSFMVNGYLSYRRSRIGMLSKSSSVVVGISWRRGKFPARTHCPDGET